MSSSRMDLVFELSNDDRVSYLLNLMQSFGCSYICLWTYTSDINLLYCVEGHFQEEGTDAHVASSSTGTTLARKLFNEYKQSVFAIGNNFVPGLAFTNKNPYLELQELDLQRLASIELQRHFYLEARIKMAVFLGCERGEIELGMPYMTQNMEMRMQTIFPQDFARVHQSTPTMKIVRAADQSRPSSSSSQSMDSPEYPLTILYTMPSTSTFLQEQQISETLPLIMDRTETTTQKSPIIMPTINQHLQNIPFPTPESTDAALTRAYLAILSTATSTTTSSLPSTNVVQQSTVTSTSPYQHQVSRRVSAFKSYRRGGVGISCDSVNTRSSMRRQNLLKSALGYYRGLNFSRMQELTSLQGTRPTTTQLHHMISERRRREKINESFQALRSLLPQGTKKDKASVLKTTKDYLSTLKTQLSELNKRNLLLETQLKTRKETAAFQAADESMNNNERLTVRITPVEESTSSMQRMVDLRVRLRGGTSLPVTDLLMRLLELLKRTREASLVSMEAQTQQETIGPDQVSAHMVTFRLRIEESEWDESSFKESIRRVVTNLGL